MTLITTNTSSNAASSSFTSGIDSTYKLYIFKFYDVNPATDEANFTFQANATDSTSYDETMITTYFSASHDEADSSTGVTYKASHDQAPDDTAFQKIGFSLGNAGDESTSGELYLFNPSNTTYVKHFYTRVVTGHSAEYTEDIHVAGYINTTTAIDDIQFKMSSGNFDGKIKMWGVK